MPHAKIAKDAKGRLTIWLRERSCDEKIGEFFTVKSQTFAPFADFA